MRWRCQACIVIVAFTAWPASTTMAAENEAVVSTTEEPSARVRTLFRQAYSAYNAKNYEESRQLLLEAWGIRQTYDIASALAQSEVKLQQYREAAAHLQYCLDNVAPSTSDKTLEAIKQTFEEAKAHVGTVHIVTNEGVSVSADGQPLGTAPLAAPIFLDPGSHELLFVRGEDTAAKTLQIEAGADEALEVAVVHVEPAPAPKTIAMKPKAEPILAPRSSRDPRLEGIALPAVIDGAVLALGLTTAIGFRVGADSNDTHAEQLRRQVGPNGCAVGAPANPICSALMDSARNKDRDRGWSAAGIIISVAALAAVPVYWYWPRSHKRQADRTGRIRLRLESSSGYSGLSVGASF